MGHSLADWLALREPFDAAARSATLARAVSVALTPDRPVRIVDLGTGRGSNVRYLTGYLPVPQEWLLLDEMPPSDCCAWRDRRLVRDAPSTAVGQPPVPRFDDVRRPPSRRHPRCSIWSRSVARFAGDPAGVAAGLFADLQRKVRLFW